MYIPAKIQYEIITGGSMKRPLTWIFLVFIIVLSAPLSESRTIAVEPDGSLTTFKKSLSTGGAGRFQAIPLSPESVLILDSKEGHFWLWVISSEKGGTLIYQGKVMPGVEAGDLIKMMPSEKKEKTLKK
jgi:hypothetical protein